MGEVSPAQVIDRYALYDKIASGGMASVYFGRLVGAAGFARTVAIKRLHPHLAVEPEFIATMIDEARLAARIQHPNVVATLDVVTHADELLIVMEYVRGESLSRLRREQGLRGSQVPLPIASAIVIGALHGLQAAHEATSSRGQPLGIVHRDVSPHNILVGVDGVARLIDFGVAKAIGRLQTTRTGVIKGKIAYMAPEQVTGGEVGRRADIYSMGVVLWELLAGRMLFQADEDMARAHMILSGAKEPPSRYAPHVPPALDSLVMRAIAKDAGERFATAKDMATELLRLLPPAFATEVGAWVEDVASRALAGRASTLAEIENRTSPPTLPPPAPKASRDPDRSGATATAAEDLTRQTNPRRRASSLPTVIEGSHEDPDPRASSLSAQTVLPPTRFSFRARSPEIALAAAVALFVAVILVHALAGRQALEPAPAQAIGSSAPEADDAPIAPSSAPPAESDAPVTSSVQDPPIAAPSLAPPLRRQPAATVRPRHTPPPKPIGGIRFQEPD